MGSSSENLLQWGLNNAESIAQGWDNTWQVVILNQNGGLYAAIVALAQLFCLGAAFFLAIRMVREWAVDGEIVEGIPQFFLAAIAIFLLRSNLFGTFTLTLRNIIHDTSTQVLQSSLNGVTLAEAIRGTMGNRVLQSSVSAIASQCSGLIGQQQVDCLDSASQQVQQLLDAYGNAYPNINLPPYLVELGRGAWGAAQTINPLLAFAMGGPGGVTAAITDTFKFLAEALLMGFQWGFANLLEAAMLLTALVGPLALAGLILPYQGKPFFGWVTGFMAIGMAEVSYNLITGLVAEMIVSAGVYEVDTFGFLVFISLLAPGLALALAAGGGMTVFSVMSNGVSRIVSSVTGGMIAVAALKK